MHREIIGYLEEYLDGTLSAEAAKAFDAHLEQCEPCREALAEVAVSRSLLEPARMQLDPAPAPSPYFFNKVRSSIEQQKPASSWWSLLLDPAFGRRVAFASLVLLAVLGSYVATFDDELLFTHPSAETLMALDQEMDNHQAAPLPERDILLVSLAALQ